MKSPLCTGKAWVSKTSGGSKAPTGSMGPWWEPGGGWHLEFTHHRGHAVTPSPTEEDLLVFYIPDERAWTVACRRMVAAGFDEVTAYNPYWDRHGRTFQDPDGYRVALAKRARD